MVLKKTSKTKEMDKDNMPKHIAFICDGNRRWAKSKGLPTLLGHREGMQAVKRVTKRIAELGIPNVSFFCFSTENFNRSEEEVSYLFDLFKNLSSIVPDLVKCGYKFKHTGDRSLLDAETLKIIDEVTEKTKHLTKGTVNIALAYGGRNDIVNAAKKIVSSGVKAEDITEESFKKYLSTDGLFDVDLLVRSSGEQRISGFMLYNMPYAELLFVKKHWPSFKAKDVDACVLEYQNRNRRYGK